MFPFSSNSTYEPEPFHPAYRRQIQSMLTDSKYANAHLDWKGPRGWFQETPFWVSVRRRRVGAALAVLSDMPGVAWWRVATVRDDLDPTEALAPLWDNVLPELSAQNVQIVAALALQDWVNDVAAELGFAHAHDVIALVRETNTPPAPVESDVILRTILPHNIDAVAHVDNMAFRAPWAHSADMLQEALNTSAYATLAVLNDTIVGYQLTTQGTYGAHLARLAVLPGHQGQRIGRLLATDMIEHFMHKGVTNIGVNTQSDNENSLKLYQSLDFQLTGDGFPVWLKWI